ncbi:Surfactin synthase thioesterase subunit [Thermoactinomyces sp. DSM 45891]|uniref:thioesterase II family protein n=1 Tax=Thermoactinomyces sp. DSM 45891 TaxID=1761907 RepID=UPI000915F84F|nr:alpha/beta fold hydrolase [Thermoactinomyces sp. DSM 45891]SFX54285.1 Surfactin synthase thioesterase subunit [Thermoactinomyces sp. DSM 45891]
MSRIKLLCLPYAGGSARVFFDWKNDLHADIELIPIELPGRGKRFGESLISDFSQLVEDIYQSIKNEINSGPYCFFGHSMGALIVFEVMRRLKSENQPMPACCILSGKNPPHVPLRNHIHTLDDEAFLAKIFGYGGTPTDMLNNEELASIFLPIIRSDFQAIELYEPPADREQMDCPFIVLYGTEDPYVSTALVKEWGLYTSSSCELYAYSGGHFFIQEQRDQVIQQINLILDGIKSHL